MEKKNVRSKGRGDAIHILIHMNTKLFHIAALTALPEIQFSVFISGRESRLDSFRYSNLRLENEKTRKKKWNRSLFFSPGDHLIPIKSVCKHAKLR